MLTIRPGMKNGEMRPGPRSSSTVCMASMSGRPPIPEPMITPTRSALAEVTSSPESAMAKSAAAMA
jgi:hypothetical protein